MIPGQGTKIPHAGWPSWKKKRNILKLFSLTYFTFTRQKDTTLKDEALRLLVPNMLQERSGEIAP